MNPVNICRLFLSLLLLIISLKASSAPEFSGSSSLSWDTFGVKGFSESTVGSNVISLDSNGTPFVAFKDVSSSNKATVMKYDGSTWITVGIRGFSDGSADHLKISIDSNNKPWVAYRDAANSNKATVMKFDGTNWVVVGATAFSDGFILSPSLQFDTNDNPWIAFPDITHSYKACVFKFDGTNWLAIGTKGFTDSTAGDPSLILDSNNTPWISYKDHGNSLKISVMKFDGSNWVVVGSKGFSEGEVYSNSIKFGTNNTPYVAYQDAATSYKANVMKFNGVNWVIVGSQGFSEGYGNYISLGVDSSNTPYVSFQDNRSSNFLTAMKLSKEVTISVLENQSTVHSLTATDADNDSPLSYTIDGGLDSAKFSLVANTGILSFSGTPDFENPADNGANNVYDLTVKVSDPSSLFSTIAFKVAILDVNEGSSLNKPSDLNINEDFSSTNISLIGNDPENDLITYSAISSNSSIVLIGGLSTNILTLNSIANSNGIATITVTATSTGGSSTQTFSVTINPINDTPTITNSQNGSGIITVSALENQFIAISMTATDLENDSLTYTINGGADSDKFSIDGSSGIISFINAPDFETPLDAGTDNTYEIISKVSDPGNLFTTKLVQITVLDTSEAIVLTKPSAVNLNEDFDTSNVTLQAFDPDGEAISFSASSSNSSIVALGTITGNNLPIYSMLNATGNSTITVTASAGGDIDSKTFVVTINPINDAPTITNPQNGSGLIIGSIVENQTVSITMTGTDTENDSPLTFSINGGLDSDKFTIGSTNGVLSFTNPPDFDVPKDNGGDNIYDVAIKINDPANANTSKSVQITVTNLNEGSQLIKPSTLSVSEDFVSTSITLLASDPESDPISYSATSSDISIVSIALIAGNTLTLNSILNSSGEATIIVTATSSGGSNTQTFTVIVNPVNDVPIITNSQNGSGVITSSASENQSFAIAMTATDIDNDSPLSFAIDGGLDSAKFSIDTSSGILVFNNSPDFDIPNDSGSDNIYDLSIKISDPSNAFTTNAIQIYLSNIDEGASLIKPSFLSLNEDFETTSISIQALDQEGDLISFLASSSDTA
ncbi:cadherin repeat domain-containing protein, partial [bacterium]|nr:cadherin repeat domain-containing protein [bacterium]